MPKSIRKPSRRVEPNGDQRLTVLGQPWQLQTAKARFSEVYRKARTQGPQLITRLGRDGVVMLPLEQFDRLVSRARQPKSLTQFFRESPLVGLDLKFERSRDMGRRIKL